MTKRAWSDYEESVYQTFKLHYPRARVSKNARIKGRLSKRSRQIDVLVVEHTPAGDVPFVVDAKHHVRKVDVKIVDAFEGFLNDIGVGRGVLITKTGYTSSALRRAYHSRRGLELDILDFSELGRFQSFVAVPYFGRHSFLISAPFGWVIDGTRQGSLICKLFQRGSTFELAQKQREFIYVKCWDRRKDPWTAEKLDRVQAEGMRRIGLTLRRISLSNRVTRADAEVRLRALEVKQYRAVEVAGFVEFKDVIFFAVLLTPRMKLKQNVRRLEHLLGTVINVGLQRDNTTVIEAARRKLEEATSRSERAALLHEIGHWYRDMDNLQRAKEYLDASLLEEVGYSAVKERLNLAAQLGESGQLHDLFSKLVSLDPTNPTVYNDAADFAMQEGYQDVLRDVLLARANDGPEPPLVKANCWMYAAQLTPDRAAALRELALAKGLFREVLQPEHYVFKTIEAFERSVGRDAARRRKRR